MAAVPSTTAPGRTCHDADLPWNWFSIMRAMAASVQFLSPDSLAPPPLSDARSTDYGLLQIAIVVAGFLISFCLFSALDSAM